jgi:hypothetical protein
MYTILHNLDLGTNLHKFVRIERYCLLPQKKKKKNIRMRPISISSSRIPTSNKLDFFLHKTIVKTLDGFAFLNCPIIFLSFLSTRRDLALYRGSQASDEGVQQDLLPLIAGTVHPIA